MPKEIAPIWRVIKEGQNITFLDYDNYKRYLSNLRDGEMELVVRKAKRERSNKQNAYYWSTVISFVSEAMGEIVPEDTHNFLREMFLKKGIDFGGNRFEIVRSTTDLSTQEFEDYLEKIRMWSSINLSIKIPLPNEID